MKVLVSGGAGYIGSTVCSALEDEGWTPVIIDSLVTGPREFTHHKIFYHGDIGDQKLLHKIHNENPEISHVIHCAALIVVPDSTKDPEAYYTENVVKSLIFFSQLRDLGIKNIVFSSSASIYDFTHDFKVTEESFIKPHNPYAQSKYMVEMILKDFCQAYGLRGLSLRYFNPIGADPKMRSGMHAANPSHVMGQLVQVARGEKPMFKITGTQWPTVDGTGLRDYIHVWDLARAHVKAIQKFDQIFQQEAQPYCPLNLGTGQGVTVAQLLKTFESVIGRSLPVEKSGPRPGDVAGYYAYPEKAEKLLGWKTELSLKQGMEDALMWWEKKARGFF